MNAYIEKMKELVKDGHIDHQEATNRIHGFKAACEGITFEEYRQKLVNLMEIGYMDKSETNANLHGFNDFSRQTV